MNKKYNIIYADPPWTYQNYNYSETKTGQKAKRGCAKEYPLMTIDDIKNLPIQNIAADDCILFIWVTFPLLIEGIETIKAWGFEYKTCGFNWIKTNKRTNVNQMSFLPQDSFDSFWGMGNWTRANAELCLIGVKGKPERKSADVHQVVYSPIDKHSKKPIIIRDKIVRLMGDLPRVELFARQNANGWDAWGNQVIEKVEIMNVQPNSDMQCGVGKKIA